MQFIQYWKTTQRKRRRGSGWRFQIGSNSLSRRRCWRRRIRWNPIMQGKCLWLRHFEKVTFQISLRIMNIDNFCQKTQQKQMSAEERNTSAKIHISSCITKFSLHSTALICTLDFIWSMHIRTDWTTELDDWLVRWSIGWAHGRKMQMWSFARSAFERLIWWN